MGRAKRIRKAKMFRKKINNFIKWGISLGRFKNNKSKKYYESINNA